MLSFNISPVQLTDRTLGLRVLSILGETGLLPTRLELEMTESVLVRDIEAAKEVLGSLRDAGVRIALVHFGTGYSSLYHRRNFKIDTIKIDRNFVEWMGVERESAEIVSALVGLGRGLGMTIASYKLQRLTSFSGRRAGLRAHGRRPSRCPSTSLPFRSDQHSHHDGNLFPNDEGAGNSGALSRWKATSSSKSI